MENIAFSISYITLHYDESKNVLNMNVILSNKGNVDPDYDAMTIF